VAARPCRVCGSPARGPRCPIHTLPPRGRRHRNAALQTVAEEGRCWICGARASADNRLVADHVVPRAYGGPDTRENMRAACAACNARRGAEPSRLIEGGANRFARATADTPATLRERNKMREEGAGVINRTGKRCTKCKRYLPFGEFRQNMRLKSGWDSWCRDCHSASNRRWRAAHPEYQRAYNLARRVEPLGLICSEWGRRFWAGRIG
jgi:5-methylcytosine-specific restriction endonuclease McrA